MHAKRVARSTSWMRVHRLRSHFKRRREHCKCFLSVCAERLPLPRACAFFLVLSAQRRKPLRFGAQLSFSCHTFWRMPARNATCISPTVTVWRNVEHTRQTRHMYKCRHSFIYKTNYLLPFRLIVANRWPRCNIYDSSFCSDSNKWKRLST